MSRRKNISKLFQRNVLLTLFYQTTINSSVAPARSGLFFHDLAFYSAIFLFIFFPTPASRSLPPVPLWCICLAWHFPLVFAIIPNANLPLRKAHPAGKCSSRFTTLRPYAMGDTTKGHGQGVREVGTEWKTGWKDGWERLLSRVWDVWHGSGPETRTNKGKQWLGG